MKKCSKCHTEKSFDEFHCDKNRKGGRKPYCKSCRSAESKNPGTKLYKHNWYLDNSEKVISKQKRRYTEDTDEIRKYKKKHYLLHADYIKEKSNNRYHLKKQDPDFKKKRYLYDKKWKRNNRHIVAWRSLLRTTLNRLRQSKTNSTINMLGYSADQLKSHIESLWTPGMTWDNYGEWHIDHIIQVHTFSKDTDVSIVNALSNLRPLWAISRTIDGVFYEGNLNRKR